MGQQPWSWGGEGICGAELLLHLAGGREVNGWASTILTGVKASNINSTKAEKPRSKTRNQITSNQLFFFKLWALRSRIWVLYPQSHWEARARLPPSPSWQRVLKVCSGLKCAMNLSWGCTAWFFSGAFSTPEPLCHAGISILQSTPEGPTRGVSPTPVLDFYTLSAILCHPSRKKEPQSKSNIFYRIIFVDK